MAREGARLGLLNAYVPGLVLRHHIDPERFRLGYLCRLMRMYGESHVLLEALLTGQAPRVPDRYRGARFVRFLGSELNSCRKRSVAFAIGKLAYHWSARGTYFRRSRAEQDRSP
jgi:hypothetical protein